MAASLPTVSVMTFNVLADVWTGWTKVNDLDAKPDDAALKTERDELLNEVTRCETIVRVVREWRPSILLLQEVQTSSFELLRKALCDSPGSDNLTYTFARFSPNRASSAPEKNGQAVFIATIDLVKKGTSLISVEDAWLEGGTLASGQDGCTAQLVRLKPDCVIANVHLEFDKKAAEAQLKVLNGAINKRRLRGVPLIVAGDLNATRSETDNLLYSTGLGDLFVALHDYEQPDTYVSGSDPTHTRQCDHILRSTGLIVNSTRFHSASDLKQCLREFGSDHTPVMATFELTASE